MAASAAQVECRAFFARARPADGTETWFLKTGLGPSGQVRAIHLHSSKSLCAELRPTVYRCMSAYLVLDVCSYMLHMEYRCIAISQLSLSPLSVRNLLVDCRTQCRVCRVDHDISSAGDCVSGAKDGKQYIAQVRTWTTQLRKLF